MKGGMRLFLTTDAVGGVWTYSLDLAAALSGKGVEVVLATLGPSASSEQRSAAAAVRNLEIVDSGLPLDWLAENESDIRRASDALAALSAEHQADIVQIHSPSLALAPYPAPVVSVIHSCVATWWSAVRNSPLPQDFAWRTALARDGMLRSDLLVTPSAAFAEAVRTTYALPQQPVAVHNGRSPLPLAELPTADFAFTAGRLWDEGKNAAAFDRAAAGSAIPFRAAGPARGPNGAAITLDHAEVLGHLTPDELASMLAKRPVFVSAARYEPFGLSVLEAAQAGCALVLSDIATFRELWDGAALFVADDAIAATVERLIASPGERAQLGSAALERASRYTPEATAAAMLDLYRGLPQQKRRAA